MISVILLMAGKGNRMNHSENKLLMPLGNKKIFEYSLDTFKTFNVEIICVISPLDQDKIVPLLPEGVKYTFGGNTRQDSVLNGLMMATNDYVIIHDAARPFISKEVINDIINNISMNEAILTYHEVKDTIKCIDGNITTLNRDSLIAATTPQCGPLNILLDSHQKAANDNYYGTDDISLVEKYHSEIKIKLIKANDEAFKITTPLDYELAMMIWRKNND